MQIALVIIALALAAVLIAAARKPDEFRVARSAVINAPPGAVFAHIDDLEKWQDWSPWARMDPDAAGTFEGPRSGVGAKFSWSGKKTGQGSMTVTESIAGELVRFRLDFLKPMKATNTAEFTLTPEGGGTRVTWSMTGKNTFGGKCFSLFIDCEKMVGEQFEKGLGYLAEAVNAPPRKAA